MAGSQQILNLTAEEALFGPANDPERLSGFIATFHPNERPLQGVAGMLDWRLSGKISSYLRAGAITGEKGEVAYIPVLLPQIEEGRTYHVLLVGAGRSPSPGNRAPIDETIAGAIAKAIRSLKIPKIGVSRSDLGGIELSFLAKHLKDVDLWVVQ